MSVESPYVGVGRKCPYCACCFGTEADFNSHARVCAERRDEKMGWRKGDSGDEICSSSADPELAASIRRNGGTVKLGRFEVHLSKNGRWLVRREVMFR